MHVFDLPDELLLEIFTDIETNMLVLDPWDWTTLTHVCRRWRRIAIDYPPLWVFPDFLYHSQERLNMFLSRASHAAVMIDNRHEPVDSDDEDKIKNKTKGRCSKCDKNVAVALKSCTNLGELRLENFDLSVLDSITRTQASTLESLDLRTGEKNKAPILLQNVFLPDSEPLPLLRDVTLYGYTISFDSVLLRGLTTLCIAINYTYTDAFNVCSTFYPTVDELFFILEACPELELLIVDYVRESTNHVGIPSKGARQPILLPCLCFMTISELSICTAETIAKCSDIPELQSFSFGLRFSAREQTSNILSLVNQMTKGVLHDEITIHFYPYNTRITSSTDRPEMKLERMNLTLCQIDETGELLSHDISGLPDSMHILTALFHGKLYSNSNSLKIYSTHPFFYDVSYWSSFFSSIKRLNLLDLSFKYPRNQRRWERDIAIKGVDHILMGLHASSVLQELQVIHLKGFNVERIQECLLYLLEGIERAGSSLRLELYGSKGREKRAHWLSSEHFDKIAIIWNRS